MTPLLRPARACTAAPSRMTRLIRPVVGLRPRRGVQTDAKSHTHTPARTLPPLALLAAGARHCHPGAAAQARERAPVPREGAVCAGRADAGAGAVPGAVQGAGRRGGVVHQAPGRGQARGHRHLWPGARHQQAAAGSVRVEGQDVCVCVGGGAPWGRCRAQWPSDPVGARGATWGTREGQEWGRRVEQVSAGVLEMAGQTFDAGVTLLRFRCPVLRAGLVRGRSCAHTLCCGSNGACPGTARSVEGRCKRSLWQCWQETERKTEHGQQLRATSETATSEPPR